MTRSRDGTPPDGVFVAARRAIGASLAVLAGLGAGRAAPARGFQGLDTATIHGATRVIELFTSQGCPKCPPADRLIASLATRPDTIALSFAVNYWDYIGWRDTLASPAFTQRQHAYAAARGDKRIFTPQAIVDGIGVEPGADEAAILRDTADLVGRDGAMRVPLTLEERDGRLHIAIGADAASRAGDLAKDGAGVYVLRVTRAETVRIDRGENSGRAVTYTNVVRAMNRIGGWSGQSVSFDMLELKGEGESYVVLVQAGTPGKLGPILAAAETGG